MCLVGDDEFLGMLILWCGMSRADVHADASVDNDCGAEHRPLRIPCIVAARDFAGVLSTVSASIDQVHGPVVDSHEAAQWRSREILHALGEGHAERWHTPVRELHDAPINDRDTHAEWHRDDARVQTAKEGGDEREPRRVDEQRALASKEAALGSRELRPQLAHLDARLRGPLPLVPQLSRMPTPPTPRPTRGGAYRWLCPG